jgi:uncharacterized membrane protein YdjX (TVP38/TMEM64 family)
MKKRNHTWKLLAVWLTLVLIFALFMYHAGRSPASIIQGSVEWLKKDPLGVPVLILLFLARPITLIPASVLSVICGYCYGTVIGMTWAMLACLLAGWVVYELGRRLGGGNEPPGSDDSRFAKYMDKLRTNGFTTTILMRWISLPYDPCSYLAGSLGVSRAPYLLATFIGNFPFTLVCVLFGAGIHGHFTGQMPHFDWRIPAGCLCLVGLSWLIYRWLRSRFAANP